MILLIDHYDSFTFNLYQYIGELGKEVRVFRHDVITLQQIKEMNPKGIVISPGPGRPEKAINTINIIQHFYRDIPILGVCLGHQAIAYTFGSQIIRSNTIMHGKTSILTHNDSILFQSIPNSIRVMRYHSLTIDKETLSEEFEITGIANDDESIMAIQHKKYPLFGLQFHPESIGTLFGKEMIHNFIDNRRHEIE